MSATSGATTAVATSAATTAVATSATIQPRSPTTNAIALIGQGGFGCVYYRGFDSHGNLLSRKYITKITKREKTREIFIGNFVSKLPGYEAFFATVISVEDINLGVIGAPTLSGCDIITRYSKSGPGTAGNDRTDDNSGTTRTPAVQFQILKELYVPNTSMLGLVETVVGNVAKLLNTLISCHGHVLVGIKRLQDECGIVHYDIKPQNVIFNTLIKNPIIIDFGLSFFIRDVHAALAMPDTEAVVALKQFFYGYFPDYDAWPMEVHIISYIVKTTIHTTASETGDVRPVAILTADALRAMVDEFMSRHNFIMYQTHAYKNRYRVRAIGHFTRIAVGRPGMTVIRNLVADWKMWDRYAVAELFLDILQVMRKTYGEATLSPIASQFDVFSTSLQRDANFI